MTPTDTPFALLGGEPVVRRIVERFYDVMERDEPALAKLHAQDPEGHVSRASRDKFGLFFIGWLGGPQTYVEQHGHPRLRMRHGRVPIDIAQRDAWLRSMAKAMDAEGVGEPVRSFLDRKLAELADFLRNRAG